LLPGLDGPADLGLGVLQRTACASVGAEDVAGQLQVRPASLAAAAVLLELVVFLAACVAAGFGMTYLSGIPLNLEERVAFGAVLGAMAVAAASFLFSLAARDVTAVTVLAGLACSLAIGAVAAFTHREQLRSDLRDVW